MNIRRIRSKYAAAGLSALVLAGIVMVSSPASATNWWVGSWNVSHSSWCYTYHAYCLYYSPGALNGHWGSNIVTPGVSNLSGATFSGSGSGVGAPVRNDAASMNNETYCDLQTYVYTNFVGNSNEVGPMRGGDLNSALRNNEASIRLVNCG